MKKINLLLVFILLFLFVFTGCGDVSKVKETIGESKIYSESELNNATEVMKNYFCNNFDNCVLNEIVYDEQYTSSGISDENYEMILTIHFLSQESNDEFRDCVLASSDKNDWHIIECGYLY